MISFAAMKDESIAGMYAATGGDSDEHFPLEDDQLHRHERCSDSAKFLTCPIANSSHAKRPAKSSFYRICATSKFHFSAALRSLTRTSCPGENSGDIKSAAIARAADHQDNRMRRSKFLFPNGKLQADRNDLLRAFEAHS